MKIEPLTEEKFEELREKHGELFEADTAIGKVYVRRATKHEFRRAVKKVRDGNLDAQDELAVCCAVFPGPGEMSRLFERYPALSIEIAEVITNVAQGEEESRAKKPMSSGAAETKTSG